MLALPNSRSISTLLVPFYLHIFRLLFSSWLSRKVGEFLVTLEADLEQDMGSMESLLGQVRSEPHYFIKSRVGVMHVAIAITGKILAWSRIWDLWGRC